VPKRKQKLFYFSSFSSCYFLPSCYTSFMLINEAQSLNLTRKHFTLIAEIIGQVDDKGNREGTAQAYAILFEQTHPRFDRAKFEAYVEEVHADCWSDNGPIYEKGV
tara:strand:+ start:57 stop:374 length:318 start_codon:yes stop_codon:yes gene_type:complete